MLRQACGRWFDYHKRAPASAACVGNTRTRQWQPALPAACSSAGFLAVLVGVVVLVGPRPRVWADLWLPRLLAYLLCVAYVNRVITCRPSSLAGRHGNYGEAALVVIVSPWLVHSAYAWDDGWLLPLLAAPLTTPHALLLRLLPALGLFSGVHIVYATRRFAQLGASWSAAQLAEGGSAAVVAAAAKLAAIVLLMLPHFHWCWVQPQGASALSLTLLYLCGSAAFVFGVARWLGPEWYPHLHHYQLALFFLFTTKTELELYSLFMSQYCVGQFIEGVTRWGAAPMFHKHVYSQ